MLTVSICLNERRKTKRIFVTDKLRKYPHGPLKTETVITTLPLPFKGLMGGHLNCPWKDGGECPRDRSTDHPVTVRTAVVKFKISSAACGAVVIFGCEDLCVE